MSEPRTAAGKALLAQAGLMHKRWPATDGLIGKHDICVIEAEAAAAERARRDALDVERLLRIEKAARAWNERPSGFMEQRELRAALAEEPSDD